MENIFKVKSNFTKRKKITIGLKLFLFLSKIFCSEELNTMLL